MMRTRIHEAKNSIRAFMQKHYTDERLAQLLCHARDGKLAYFSCCCFIGVVAADHKLAGHMSGEYSNVPHYQTASRLEGAREAERGYCELMAANWRDREDRVRRRILIPIIRAEMKRREIALREAQVGQLEAGKLEQMRIEEYDARANTR